MQVLDFKETHSQYTTNGAINVANANPINLDKDIFYNKLGKYFELWTGPNGTGTQLTEVTDYALGGEYPDEYFPYLITPDVGYTTLAITNAIRQGVDLYPLYYPIMDIVNSEKWNELDAKVSTLPFYETFTASKTIGDAEYINVLNFDLSGNGNLVCGLPNPAIRINEIFIIKAFGGSRGVDDLTMSGDNIAGVVASTFKIHDGQLMAISNGTDYELLGYNDIFLEDSGTMTTRVNGKRMKKTWLNKTMSASETTYSWDVDFANIDYTRKYWMNSPLTGRGGQLKWANTDATYKLVGSMRCASYRSDTGAVSALPYDIVLEGDYY